MNTKLHSFVYILPVPAFTLSQQNSVVAADSMLQKVKNICCLAFYWKKLSSLISSTELILR